MDLLPPVLVLSPVPASSITLPPLVFPVLPLYAFPPAVYGSYALARTLLLASPPVELPEVDVPPFAAVSMEKVVKEQSRDVMHYSLDVVFAMFPFVVSFSISPPSESPAAPLCAFPPGPKPPPLPPCAFPVADLPVGGAAAPKPAGRLSICKD